MALEHAILVSLAEQPATGYDLARRFDASIGFFWQASHQQIYRVLARMESNGLVAARTESRDGRLHKKTYDLTEEGRGELTAWSREPSPREALRSDFAVKLRGFTDPGAIAADTRRRRADHADRLERYLASEKRHYRDPRNLPAHERGSWLVLRGGILTEQQGIAWCDEILAQLDSQESDA